MRFSAYDIDDTLGGFATEIAVEFSGPPTGQVFSDQVARTLRSKGWSVVRVSHLWQNLYAAIVNGNTDDNLSLVATNLQRALAGLGVYGARASFTNFNPATNTLNAGDLATVTISASGDTPNKPSQAWDDWIKQYGAYAAVGVVALLLLRGRR